MDSLAGLHLVLLKGFPATGKSMLAHRLSRSTGWPVIDKDDIKDHTLCVENGNELAYDIMWSVTRTQLALRHSVIVDSPLTYPIAYETGLTLAKQHGAHLLVVETHLDDEIWRSRLDERDDGKSDHKIAGWDDMQALLARYDGCWTYPIVADQHMIVDTSRPVGHLVRDVIARLAEFETQAVPVALSASASTAQSTENNVDI